MALGGAADGPLRGWNGSSPATAGSGSSAAAHRAARTRNRRRVDIRTSLARFGEKPAAETTPGDRRPARPRCSRRALRRGGAKRAAGGPDRAGARAGGNVDLRAMALGKWTRRILIGLGLLVVLLAAAGFGFWLWWRAQFLPSGGPLRPRQAAFDVRRYDLAVKLDPATR